MYVIVRDDGKYVACPGLKSSYTTHLRFARGYKSFQAACADRCPENERVVDLADLPGVAPDWL